MTKVKSLAAQRAEALFGASPTFTFQSDDAESGVCCSIRLLPKGDGAWLGLVADNAMFTDHVRMGFKVRFVVHHNADIPTICGEAEIRLVGRAAQADSDDIDDEARRAIARLVDSAPFLPKDAIVIEVQPHVVQVDEGETPAHGAIPRT